MKRLTFLALAVVLSLAPTLAHANSLQDLEQGLARSSWHQAMRGYQATTLDKSIPRLTLLAQQNVVMAQWFLADALAAAGRDQEAAAWLYTASLGTRMDASVCRMREAKAVEYRFIQAFDKRFSVLRQNPNLRRHGITQAVSWHNSRRGHSAQSHWVCQLVALEADKAPRSPLVPERQWVQKRTGVLEDYQEQSGIDFSRSVDLIRITPTRK